MVSITLSTFIDFLLARNASRLSKVRDAKHLLTSTEEYRQVDYYQRLRRPIVDLLLSDGDPASLDACLARLRDGKKVDNYRAIRDGLTTWAGSTSFEGHSVPRRAWRSGDLTVTVRPQARVEMNGESFIVWCYLKADPLDRHRVQTTLHLLGKTHGKLGTPLILEARTGKTYKPGRKPTGMDALLRAEAAAFLSLWEDDLDVA